MYEGDWVDDKYDGEGKYFWPDGNMYQGEWVNGERNGQGKMIFANGS